MNSVLDDILPLVRKPGRYLGNEWNAARKDLCKQEVKFAICFPDLYEIGMSNLGLRIIYGLLNSLEGIACERAFLPDTDMQEILKARKLPLFSLESKAELRSFDFVGFCASYELCYTNILAVLDLSGIPLLATQRSFDFPLVIAGGSCAGNPEPLADFIDLFLVGEAEDALPEIIEIYKNERVPGSPKSDNKEDVLKKLARIEGVYVPSFYKVEYGPAGCIKGLIPKYPDIPLKIKKRIVKNLDDAYYPAQWLVPYVQIVHDRAPIELMRGCPHRCNFCQAKSMYGSLRLRSPEKAMELAFGVLQSSGYEEVSLLSLSTSNYPYLKEVVAGLSQRFKEQAVAVSLPSLRPKSYLGGLAEFLAKVRKTTLTFAPEAGSDRMRDFINKNFSMEEFYSAVRAAYVAGWQAIKLYFMIGLPGEEYSDLDGILEVAQKVSTLRKESAKWAGEVRLSISFFVPKPHTVFEKEAMEPKDSLRAKIIYLREKSRRLAKIRLDFHKLETSILEAVFSRGDRTLGKVVLEAYRNGCMLDSWPEHFKPDAWLKAFAECNKTYEPYLGRKCPGNTLPWHHIDLMPEEA